MRTRSILLTILTLILISSCGPAPTATPTPAADMSASGPATPTPTAEPAVTNEPTARPTATVAPLPAQQVVTDVLVFVVREGEQFSLYSFKPDRDEAPQLLLAPPDTGTRFYGPIVSPDASRIAYYNQFDASTYVLELNSLGEVAREPRHAADCISPSFSPDGSQFVCYVEGQTILTLHNSTSGGQVGAVETGMAGASLPAWSPDGSEIAFSVIHPDGSSAIYKISASSGDPVELAVTGFENMAPSWSPDGTQIAYQHRETADAPAEIWVMDGDGRYKEQLVFDTTLWYRAPSWSPDGRSLVFVGSTGGSFGDVYAYSLSSGETTRVTDTGGQVLNWRVSWAKIIYSIDGADCQPQGEFLGDVTIPAGMRFLEPRDFAKIWQVRNTGTCTWADPGYTLRLLDGDPMGAAPVVPIPQQVTINGTVSLNLELTTPQAPGMYTADWGLFDMSGRQVTGPDGNPLILPVSIEILSPGQAVLPAPIYYLSQSSGRMQVWRLETDGVTGTQVTDLDSAVLSFAVSPADGTVAAVTGTTRNATLYLVSATGGEPRTPFPYSIHCSDQYACLAWSPNGRFLAYATATDNDTVTGGLHIYDVTADEDRLLRADVGMGGSADPNINTISYFPVQWSPDGGKILVEVDSELFWMGMLSFTSDLQLFSVTSGTQLNQRTDRAYWTYMFDWGNDQQSLFLAGPLQDIVPRLQAMTPGLWQMGTGFTIRQRIEGANVAWPNQRPDGKLLYFIDPLAGVPTDELGELLAVPDGTYFGSFTLALSDADGGHPTVLREEPIFSVSGDFLVLWSPDANSFLATIRDSTATKQTMYFPSYDEAPILLPYVGENMQWGP